ncbi:MAG: hypothetical protein IDH49_15005 [Gammaproteobacteria bacterium]|nr:hypothetical protein [Gammaproteobacteria bacterium]
MKWPYRKLLFITFTLIFIDGCGTWKDFDKPTPFPWEYWRKAGYTQDEVRKFLYRECGFSYQSTRDEMKKEDKCMLENGFVFHDIKYGGVYICDHQINQDLPSCQSIRGDRQK